MTATTEIIDAEIIDAEIIDAEIIDAETLAAIKDQIPFDGAPNLVRLADVKPEAVRWLWPGRIAIGKVTMLAGDPGLGKSFITLDLAARVSTGAAWPDCLNVKNGAGGVVLLSAEDDLADTIRPRLDAAGADCGRIAALQGVKLLTGERMFSLDKDLPHLEAAVDLMPDCRLVVIDPITAYLGETDSHKNAEMRALLAPLGELASRKGVAVVCVNHLNKGSGPAMYRAMGSVAFVAAARAAWAVTKDREDITGKRRLLLPLKNNLGPDDGGLAYRLADGRVEWESGAVTVTADEALARDDDRAPGPEPEAQREAVRWLRDLLGSGQVLAADVKRQAGECGISGSTLNRAKGKASVEAYRTAIPGPWYWRLSPTLPQPEHLEHLEHLAENKNNAG